MMEKFEKHRTLTITVVGGALMLLAVLCMGCHPARHKASVCKCCDCAPCQCDPCDCCCCDGCQCKKELRLKPAAPKDH